MSVRPGGALAARPLHFFWLLDASGSMAEDGKMRSLNDAIRQALPAVQRVAANNPHAAILMRTLRFAAEARWLDSGPVELARYAWSDLSADEVQPGTAAFSAEFRHRLEREGAQSGDVQVSLSWDNYNDLDLSVTCPCGARIYFAEKKCPCGGELDVDMNFVSSRESERPIENVFWPEGGAPAGRYVVSVTHFKNRSEERPRCQDPTSYTVAVKTGGVVKEFRGTISHGDEPPRVHEFDFAGASAPGKGNTNLGAALRELTEQLQPQVMPGRGLPPVVVLVTDGHPTDDWEAPLAALLATPWGKKAARIGIAIGGDVDAAVLSRFIANGALPVLQARNPEMLVEYIKWASTAVVQAASSPMASFGPGHTELAPQLVIPAPPLPRTVKADDVW